MVRFERFMKRRLRSSGGFTFLEAVIVVSITAILAVVAAPSFQKMLARLDMRASAHSIKYRLLSARSRAMSDIDVHCGVHFDQAAGTFRMFLDVDTSGANANRYSSGDTWYREAVELHKNVEFKAPHTNADILHAVNSAAIVFRGDGSAAPDQGTTITLRHTALGLEKSINVLPSTGRIRVE